MKWSEGKTFKTGSGQLEIKTKFLHQQGTTCLTGITLGAGETVTYELEKRECPLKWGTSTDMQLCAECKPVVSFLK